MRGGDCSGMSHFDKCAVPFFVFLYVDFEKITRWAYLCIFCFDEAGK